MNSQKFEADIITVWIYSIFGGLTIIFGLTFALVSYLEWDTSYFLHVIFIWNFIVYGQILPFTAIFRSERMKTEFKKKFQNLFQTNVIHPVIE